MTAAYSRIMTRRAALSLVLAVTVAGSLPGGGASAAPDQGEGIRDCGNVASESWVHYIRSSDDTLEYKGTSKPVVSPTSGCDEAADPVLRKAAYFLREPAGRML